MQSMPFSSLRRVVAEIGRAYTDCRMSPSRSIASWRISEPFDYYVKEQWETRTSYDVAQLWDLPSTRPEDPEGIRFRINVKTTQETRDDAYQFVAKVLERVGFDTYTVSALMTDSKRIVIKPVYDLGSNLENSPVTGAIKITQPNGERYKPTPETRDRYQYGIYPDGQVKIIDMYAFREIPIFAKNGLPVRVNMNT